MYVCFRANNSKLAKASKNNFFNETKQQNYDL